MLDEPTSSSEGLKRGLLRIVLALGAAVGVLAFAVPLIAVPERFAAPRGWLPTHAVPLRGLGLMALCLSIGAILAARKPEGNRALILVLMVALFGAGGLGVSVVAVKTATLWVAVDSAVFLVAGALLAFLFPPEGN